MSTNDSGQPGTPQDKTEPQGSADPANAQDDQTDQSVASALVSFNLFRTSRNLPEAMVWLRTADLLDPQENRFVITSPVNIALLQVLGDTLMRSESIILHCGNILDRHGELLDITGDALDMLTQRLVRFGHKDKGYHMAYLMRGHIETLFVTFKHKLLGDRTFEPTRADEGVKFVDTIVACLGLLQDLQLPSSTLDLSRNPEDLAKIIDTALSNANGEIFGFPLKGLSDLDKVAFYVKNAERLVATLPATRTPSQAAYVTALTTLKSDIATVLSNCQSKDITATRNSLKKARATLQQLGYPLSDR